MMLRAEFELPYFEKDTANQFIRPMKELCSYLSGSGRVGTYELGKNEERNLNLFEIPNYAERSSPLMIVATHNTKDNLGADYTKKDEIVSSARMNSDIASKSNYHSYDCWYTHMNQYKFSDLLDKAIKKGISDEKDGYEKPFLYFDGKYEFDNLSITSEDMEVGILFSPGKDSLNISLYADEGVSKENANLVFSALEFAELNHSDVKYLCDGLKEAFDNHSSLTFRYKTHRAVEKTKSWFSSAAGKLTGWLRN